MTPSSPPTTKSIGAAVGSARSMLSRHARSALRRAALYVAPTAALNASIESSLASEPLSTSCPSANPAWRTSSQPTVPASAASYAPSAEALKASTAKAAKAQRRSTQTTVAPIACATSCLGYAFVVGNGSPARPYR